MSLTLDHLLQPIAGSSPCGVDCSFSNEFHAIKKARTQDDPLLDQGDWVSEPKQADWPFIHAKSVELLTEKTKDIRLYAWLLEAWTHLYGFEGTAKGLELTQRSLSHYWIQLHPEIEADDLDQRIGLIQGLINLVPVLLKSVPIVSIQPAYTLADYDGLLHQQNQKRKLNLDDESSEAAAHPLEQFEHALFSTPKQLQYQNYQQFLDILSQWQQLKDILDRLMGLDAPSFSSIDSQIEMIHLTLKKIYKADAFASSPAAGAPRAPNAEIPAEAAPDHLIKTMSAPHSSAQAFFQPQQQSHLANREQAMRLLQEIADYFQANEPHSPVSYLLQKTIKWSRMPLHEWLSQVIKNENPLEAMQELLGVQAHTSETNSDW